jgi:hypothetical protein
MQLCILKGVTAMVAHDEQATTYNLLAVVAEACGCGEQNSTDSCLVFCSCTHDTYYLTRCISEST